MYLWKCWRDTRSTFLIVVGAIVACAAFGLFVQYDPAGWIAAKAEWPRTLWRSTAQAMMLTMIGAMPIVGFVLGAMGVGTEFEKRSADFLLTRPRSRRHLLWTSWGVGAAQMIVLVTLSVTVNWIARYQYPGGPLRTVRGLLGMWLVALTIYSVTYLMTTLARNSRSGVGLAVLVFCAYTGLYTWLKLWYNLEIPFVFQLTFSSGRGAFEVEEASVFLNAANVAMFGWTAVCVALTFAAQYVFERQEV